MSGYTPVFRSVFEGTLCGQYPDTAAWLFLLALSDKNGHVDKTPQYIAAVTGMPVEDLIGCIERFMQPDPVSRSDAEEGRRLVLIDPNRNWGWRIVNHAKYREQARLAAKNVREIEDGKNLERMRHRRDTEQGPPVTAGDRREPPVTDPSNAKANTDTEGAKAPRGSRRCPSEFEPDRAYAVREIPGIDVEREVQKFKDWEFKTARKDWPAVWRTWIGNARDRNQYAKAATAGKIDPREWQ